MIKLPFHVDFLKLILTPLLKCPEELLLEYKWEVFVINKDTGLIGIKINCKDEPEAIKLISNYESLLQWRKETPCSVYYIQGLSSLFVTKVLTPLVEGKFSKIEPRYIKKHFFESFFDENGDIVENIVYRVCTKDPTLRKEMEEYLDVIIPGNFELASKPRENDLGRIWREETNDGGQFSDLE